MKRYAIVTLFPEMMASLTQYGISGRAFREQLYGLECVNPRDFAEDKHRTVDDKPYGGGPGMVMAYPPLAAAIDAAQNSVQQPCCAGGAQADTDGSQGKPLTLYLSPQGKPLTHRRVSELAKMPGAVLLCGRYEGIDERVVNEFVDEEISIGDFVVSGGELPAMMLLDAMIRLLPGAIGDSESAQQDSFAGTGLLDYPHYTRPETLAATQSHMSVPDVLLSGDHAKIADWRIKQSVMRTAQRRPELLKRLVDEEVLSEAERQFISALLND